ncbi:tetratricopeptide repeat protein [Nonomuraea sp. NPDC046802]|uniref:tetratricopeptide repeat protein n=1 Tax=Nonomuraea sp. NPDC046802 TaxID=3154919 RepID=UPI0033C25983
MSADIRKVMTMDWPARIRDERQARDWDVHSTARRLRAAAGDESLPDHDSLVRAIRRWESGKVATMTERYRLLYGRIFSRDVRMLFGSHENNLEEDTSREEEESTNRRDALKLGLAATLGQVLGEAADEALEFTRRANTSAVGRGTLDHLHTAVCDIAGSYARRPPVELFPVARLYRRRVDQLIAGPHTLKEQRELFVYAGWLSEILAWLAHDLGDPLTGEAYAIDCFEHADQAGHDELCAWAADAMASIALHADQPSRAVSAALRGLNRVPVSHPLAVRLHAQASRGHARLGNRDDFQDTYQQADNLWNALPTRTPARPDGTDTGPLAAYAMTTYTASSYLWLGDYEQARHYAERAVRAHEVTPAGQRSLSREAIAHLDLGIALAHLGALDKALAHGLRALGSPRMVTSVQARAADLDAVLAAKYPGTGQAAEFQAAVAATRVGTAP